MAKKTQGKPKTVGKTRKRSAPASRPVQDVSFAEIQLATRGKTHWPDGLPMPRTIRGSQFIPCEECGRIRTDELFKAVVVTSPRDGFAYVRCRCCGHRFKIRRS